MNPCGRFRPPKRHSLGVGDSGDRSGGATAIPQSAPIRRWEPPAYVDRLANLTVAETTAPDPTRPGT